MATTPGDIDFFARAEKVREYAQRMYDQNPNWVIFFREIFGVDGAVRKVFPQSGEYVRFEQTKEHQAITDMLNALAAKARTERIGARRMITIRLPDSIHAALLMQSEAHGMSLNRLCIAKLLQGAKLS